MNIKRLQEEGDSKQAKEENLSMGNNWRGINLERFDSKSVGRIIFYIISAAIDPQMGKKQAGFSKGNSSRDHIFTLRQIVEQSQEGNIPVYADFDFENSHALDSWLEDSTGRPKRRSREHKWSVR